MSSARPLSATTERVSLATGGAQGDDDSWLPWISADGRFVGFTGSATNLVTGDTNALKTYSFAESRLRGPDPHCNAKPNSLGCIPTVDCRESI
jgi:hypothetical protein